MKKEFNPQYIFDNSGCYTEDRVRDLSFIKKENIDILDILNSEISLKDKGWFLIKKCEFTLDQKKEIAYNLALIILPVYEKKYPEDKRVRECIEAIVKFKNGEISKEELLTKHNHAVAVFAVAVAATATAVAATAVVATAFTVAVATAIADDAVATAIAVAANTSINQQALLNYLIEFVNNN